MTWTAASARPEASREGAAYNGHFGRTYYHPLFVFNQFGDLKRCVLRPGNVHSADGWRDVLEPVVSRYLGYSKLRRYFRADTAFATAESYEFLEAEEYKYTIRLSANTVLQESIGWVVGQFGSSSLKKQPESGA